MLRPFFFDILLHCTFTYIVLSRRFTHAQVVVYKSSEDFKLAQYMTFITAFIVLVASKLKSPTSRVWYCWRYGIDELGTSKYEQKPHDFLSSLKFEN